MHVLLRGTRQRIAIYPRSLSQSSAIIAGEAGKSGTCARLPCECRNSRPSFVLHIGPGLAIGSGRGRVDKGGGEEEERQAAKLARTGLLDSLVGDRE
jgi:hypothetical protein